MRRLLPLLLAATTPLALPAGLRAREVSPTTVAWTSTLLDDKGAPVAGAVVSLTPLDRSAPPVPEGLPPVEIAQAGMEYRPAVTAIQVGTAVEFPNRDDIQHHLYSVSRPKRFEKPLYPPGAKEVVVFDQPGVVLLGCNIHDWMSAHVVVLETPHFALSDDSGTARIAALPPGRYRLDLWHARLAKPLSREVVLAPGEPAPGGADTLSLRPERRARRAPSPERPGGY